MKTFEPINGRLLSMEEIKERLDAFNENVPYDWSLFEGVHPLQAVSFMYPFYIKPITINMAKQYQEPGDQIIEVQAFEASEQDLKSFAKYEPMFEKQ